jgi:pimeloyl-ACP methyl ester carboxylesterase
VPETLVTDVRATPHRSFAGSTAAIERYVSERPLHERLAALRVPVEVVFGLRDRRVDPASLAIYESVPRARVRTIDSAGHTPPWEAPEQVAAAINVG